MRTDSGISTSFAMNANQPGILMVQFFFKAARATLISVA
jgi:hypothetical protein